jgi:enoyl-CoA hydratase
LTDYAQFDHLAVTREDGVAVVILSPVQEGEVEPSLFTNVRDVLGPLALDPDVRAVVITGRDDMFFTGTGLTRTLRMLDAGLEQTAGQMLTLKQIVDALLAFRKPTVAAVNGPATNIGAQLALLCDAAVAAQEATFADHHVMAGLPAGDGGTMMWPLLLGMARAREIVLRGVELTSREALELHLVSEVVPREQTVPAAVALARRLAALPRLPYFATKQALNSWWQHSATFAWDAALGLEAAALSEPAFAESLRAAASGDPS